MQTLRFGGTVYLDADRAVPAAEVGGPAGETDPNPAQCGILDRQAVYHHTGHLATAEVVYREPDGRSELFVSAGSAGFPLQGTIRWLVLALVIVILVFAALPALIGHLRPPPPGPEVGGGGLRS